MSTDPVSDFRDVLAPIDAAKGLPNVHYVDDAMYRHERERLFFDQWAAVGFGKDIPGPGDAKPIDFLGMPLVLSGTKKARFAFFRILAGIAG